MVDPEHDLIDAIASGDVDAFERLVRRYRNPLLNFICRYLGDRPTSEDLTQEVFLRIYRAAGRFEPRTKVSSWVFRIAYNLAMNELKRRRRFLALREDIDGTEVQVMDDGSLRERESIDMKEEIATAMAGLPESQRAALLLRVNEEMSYREIADVMGLSVAGVESLIFRARRHLKNTLRKH